MPPVESSAYGKPVTEFFCTLKGGANTTENLICIKGVVEACNQRTYMKPARLNLLVLFCFGVQTQSHQNLLHAFNHPPPLGNSAVHIVTITRINTHITYNHNGMSLGEKLLCTHVKQKGGACKHHPENVYV